MEPKKIKNSKDVGSHYNFVTDAWRLIMGNNFHFGYFRSANMSLPEATNALIDELAKLGNITEDSKILDVGCGIGGPAFNLHKKYRCSIIGITNSKRGVELARKENKIRGYTERLQFQLVDILDNEFPDSSFDLAWIMESSHLISRKKRLFSELYRLLKDNGAILLCDIILKRKFTSSDYSKYRRELNILSDTFGDPQIMSLKYYQEELRIAGFSKVITRDISKETFPTIEHWRKNIVQSQNQILQITPQKKMDDFLVACDILKTFYQNNIVGYGLIKAVK